LVLWLSLGICAGIAGPLNSLGQSVVSAASQAATPPLDEAVRVTLKGNVHPLAQPRFDAGRVDDSFPVERLILLLNRSNQQELALERFLNDAHTPGTPSYHQWLTPTEFGNRFGADDTSIAVVKSWLQSHGFTINHVHAGRTAVEFSGTAGQLNEVFHTEIHRYLIDGKTEYANAGDPQIPAALAGLIAGISPMNSFHGRPLVKVAGKTSYNVKTHEAKPEWTYPDGNGYITFEFAPADFAVQYNVSPVYAAGTKGAGVSIGLISLSNIDLSLVQAYQKVFGLPANLPTVVIDGVDPGENGAAIEAYLDVEQAGAIAPGAKVMLYASNGTVLTDGLLTAGLRAIEDNIVSVISMSYGNCESSLGASGNAAWAALWQEAAAQGITGFVSAGDGGSAGCDDFDTEAFATGGLAVNGFGSTPYNVSVGGTDFYYSDYAVGGSTLNSQLETYWSFTTSDTPKASLLKPIPEQVWNASFGLNTTDGGVYSTSDSSIVAGSGGASAAAIYPQSGLPKGYPKPAWQTGTGVPADKVRDLPDVSLYASDGYNYSLYPICAVPGDCVNETSAGAIDVTSVGGTSASSPAMAGIQALVDQATQSRQGQADYVYYALANKSATANTFNDVKVGGNEVPCTQGTPNCVLGTSGQTKGVYAESGYPATTGYDLATGLGTVNVANLIKNWSSVTFKPTVTTLTVSPTTAVHGTTLALTAAVDPKTGTGTPTGSIGLVSNDTQAYANGLGVFSLSGGAVKSSIDNLPGGSYQVVADYSGDGTYAASASNSVTVTITPEADTLKTSAFYLSGADGTFHSVSPGASIPYGSEFYLDAQPVGVNEAKANLGQNAPATGAITFTDKGSATLTASVPLNSQGLAEFTPGTLSIGSHVVSAAYAGDASYQSSSAPAAAKVTVTKGLTTLYVYALEGSDVKAGSDVTVDVEMFSNYLPLIGTLPTGHVSVTLGGQTLTAPFKSWYGGGGLPVKQTDYVQEAILTFPKVKAGTLALSAQYAGDANWAASATTGSSVSVNGTLPTPTVTLTAKTTSYKPTQTVTMTGTVKGTSTGGVPSGLLYFSWYGGGSYYDYYIQPVNSTTAAWTLTFPANELVGGSNLFVATYYGDSHYSAQSSAPLVITLDGSDFSLTTTTQAVKVAAGASGKGSISLVPIDAYTGTVAITCAAPSGITCAPATASPTLPAAGATDAITINAAASVKAGAYPVVVTASGGGHVHTAGILAEVP